MMKKVDWSIVKGSAYLFFVLAIISAAAIGGCYYYMDGKYKIYNNQKNDLEAIQSNYSDLIKKIDIFEEYAMRFSELQERGVIGHEKRLTWVESLQEANKALKLPQLRYKISPQKGVDPIQLGPDIMDVYVSKSDMNIQAGLLHEGDLFQLLNGLKNNAKGHFLIDSCEMQPTDSFNSSKSDNSEIDISKPIIQANCDIHWIQVSMELPTPEMAGGIQ